MRAFMVSLGAGVLSLSLLGCGGDSTPAATATPGTPAATATPPIPAGESLVDATADNRWDPEELAIAAGESVTFRWTGPVPHNIRIDGLIDTPVTATGQYRVTVETPGTYTYICDVHLATMVGTLTVE
jgi:plastocyanin